MAINLKTKEYFLLYVTMYLHINILSGKGYKVCENKIYSQLKFCGYCQSGRRRDMAIIKFKAMFVLRRYLECK